ncbi:hypothetical protein EDD21DRAFT_385228 [Dissophora ornata]|nr:hypothetical protein BGZ58_009706 [Dissophora ornata]KAI8597529.1 hypothetical protein EDD21DRAFT_385228 [Dissophora ornata]
MPSSLSIPDTTVCQDLDNHVLQYMALIDEHLAAWNRISARFQEGRELISQAKYIMGPRNVSADCYDHRMKALRGVAVNGPGEIALRDLLAEQKRAAEEVEEVGQNEQANNEYGTGTGGLNDEEQNGRSGLRRRGGATSGVSSGASSMAFNDGDGTSLVDENRYKKKGSDTTGEEITRAIIDTTIPSAITATTTTAAAATKKKKERNRDPLLWFGVFVPAPLRNAQSVFQKGLQDVVEMAMIRQRLLELEETIKTLQQVKDKSTQQAMPDLATLSLVAASSEQESRQ